MPKLIASPTRIASVGNITKFADEYSRCGNHSHHERSISVAALRPKRECYQSENKKRTRQRQ